MYKCPYETDPFQWAEYILFIVFVLNAFFHLWRWKSYPAIRSPKPRNPEDYRSEALTTMIRPTISPKCFPAGTGTGDGPRQAGFGFNSSPNYGVDAAKRSPIFSAGSSSPTISPDSRRGRPTTSRFTSTPDEIIDERSLREYLKSIKENETIALLNDIYENGPKDPSGAFWNHPLIKSFGEISPLSRRQLYQLAPLNSDLPQMCNPSNENLPKSPQTLPQAFRQLNFDNHHLTQWNANIRRWITSTILENILKEIESIDENLAKHGSPDTKIGYVGLDRLRKIAQNSQLTRRVPTLPILVPFLEICNNQEYLVQRIKELASGGCMSDFKWNGGGNLHGKPWDETLPTDSALIMHFFATYLDTQLLPVAQNPEGLPFTTRHFCRIPEKPVKSQDSLIIYQSCINPPHYLLVTGEDTVEVSKGRNNLIHTLLLFLHTLVTEHHGMLGRVNLGKSGINISWVIDG